MTEAVAVAAGVNASLSATQILADAAGTWGGLLPREMQVAKFRTLADKNSVLGFSSNLKREKYAITPIIQALHQSDDRGAVSIALVPPALGKTTAVHFFLKSNKTAVRGIALCPRGRGLPYVTQMLKLLGLNSSRPPDGWLSCLIDALKVVEEGNDVRRTYLFLDEFVNEITDRVDSSLVEELKSQVRNTNIRVILLTPSEDYANFLLSRNNLEGILPLKGTYPVDEYPSGRWKSMVWPEATIRIAARNEPCLAKYSTEQIDGEIDRFIATLETSQAEELSYLKVLTALRSSLDPVNTLRQLDVTASASVDSEDEPFCNACVAS